MRLSNIAKGNALHKVGNLQTTRGKFGTRLVRAIQEGRVTRTPLAKGGEWLLNEEVAIMEEFDPSLANGDAVHFVRRWQR
jgi:hypothetical protein